MSFETGFVFAVILLVIVLFVSERFRVDQVSLLIPLLLVAGGAIDLEGATAGLTSPATLTVTAMLVLSLGLVKTGAIRGISRWATTARLGGGTLRIFILCVVVASVSPFLNNTAVVVAFLPVFMEVARHVGQRPSKVLMPLSFAAILGGTVTLVGTSTNLVVHGMAKSRGFDELSMFSIAPLGLIYLAIGLAYLFTVGRRLLPEREESFDLASQLEARSFSTELEVAEDSPVVGASLAELDWNRELGISVVAIERRGRLDVVPRGRRMLRAGDILFVRGEAEQLLTLAARASLITPPERVLNDEDGRGGSEAGGAGAADADDADPAAAAPPADEGHLAEFLVSTDSSFLGRTLRDLRFRDRYDVVVVAIQRPGSRMRTRRLHELELEPGDLLLVQGWPEALAGLSEVRGLVPLGEVPRPVTDRPRALVAVAIMAAVVGAAALGLVSLLAAAFAGVVLMIYTGCARLEEVYAELDWTVVVLLAGLLPLGVAMDETGAAAWIADALRSLLSEAPTPLAIGVFYLVASLLTEIMSNHAAAAVLTPVAIGAAAGLGLSPYALLVAVMFGCSASFMTPVGYQTNTLIYGPGGYRFTDFLRVGAPLNLLLLLTASFLIPLFWAS